MHTKGLIRCSQLQSYDSGVGNNAGDAELYPYNAIRPRRSGMLYGYY